MQQTAQLLTADDIIDRALALPLGQTITLVVSVEGLIKEEVDALLIALDKIGCNGSISTTAANFHTTLMIIINRHRLEPNY